MQFFLWAFSIDALSIFTKKIIMTIEEESAGDYVDAEDHAYSVAYQAVMNIYGPLDYEEFVKILDIGFKSIQDTNGDAP